MCESFGNHWALHDVATIRNPTGISNVLWLKHWCYGKSGCHLLNKWSVRNLPFRKGTWGLLNILVGFVTWCEEKTKKKHTQKKQTTYLFSFLQCFFVFFFTLVSFWFHMFSFSGDLMTMEQKNGKKNKTTQYQSFIEVACKLCHKNIWERKCLVNPLHPCHRKCLVNPLRPCHNPPLNQYKH